MTDTWARLKLKLVALYKTGGSRWRRSRSREENWTTEIIRKREKPAITQQRASPAHFSSSRIFGRCFASSTCTKVNLDKLSCHGTRQWIGSLLLMLSQSPTLSCSHFWFPPSLWQLYNWTFVLGSPFVRSKQRSSCQNSCFLLNMKNYKTKTMTAVCCLIVRLFGNTGEMSNNSEGGSWLQPRQTWKRAEGRVCLNFRVQNLAVPWAISNKAIFENAAFHLELP